MDKIHQILKESGLSDKESAVYIALLRSGTASAYTVAEKSGLKPPTAYLTLQNLIYMGLAFTIPQARKKLFSAKDPADVITDLENRAAKAKSVLPEMQALIPKKPSQINVQYYQGIAGIQEALKYGKKHDRMTKEIVGFYASGENISNEYIEMSRKYLNSLHRSGITIRGITPKHASTSEFIGLNAALGNILHPIPYKDYSSHTSIEVEETFVRIVMNDEQKALIIDDAELARTVRQIFDMVWKNRVTTDTAATLPDKLR